MLERIKKKVFEKYSPEEKKGLFFSVFDVNAKIALSNGILETDKTLGNLIDSLYYGILEKSKNTATVLVCDIVLQVVELIQTKDILSASVKENGFFLISLDGTKSGVLLPDTAEVADAKNALSLIKQKFGLEGKVKVYTFKTDRFQINIK